MNVGDPDTSGNPIGTTVGGDRRSHRLVNRRTPSVCHESGSRRGASAGSARTLTDVSTAPRSILDDLVLAPVAGIDGRFSLSFDPGWKVLYVFGGVTFAALVQAVVDHLGREDLTPISAQATYIEPVVDGPAAVHVDIIRSGRRGAQARATLWNTADPTDEGSPAITMDVMLGRPDAEVGGFLNTAIPADAGRPADGLPRDAMADRFVDVPFHHQSDFRMIGSLEDLAIPEPRSVSWFRLFASPIDESGAWRPAALALPGDMMGPVVSRGMNGERFFVVTLQLSIQWFAPARSEWICQHAVGLRAGSGFATGTTELFDEAGTLVAFATQTALMRPFARVQADVIGAGMRETQG